MQYLERLEQRMGGSQQVDEFYKLFLAPGVARCRGGMGPAPLEPFSALGDWVELGKAPVTLRAIGVDQNETHTVLTTMHTCNPEFQPKGRGLLISRYENPRRPLL